MPVIVLLADGVRYDALAGDLGALPALERLRREGALHRITSVFPSVTGPAYTPFLLGRFPGEVGVPGIRWLDRSRTAAGWPGHARSYVGWQIGRIDGDLDARAPTMFDLVPRSMGAMSMITRGLPRARQIGGLTPALALRAARTHFGGQAARWLDVDRDIADEVLERLEREVPDYAFIALSGVDKASHARGHEAALVSDALAIVDGAVARIRAAAERGGWWERTHLWVVSDHGHGAVHQHEDLSGLLARWRHRVLAHPWVMRAWPDVAVMVSGNAMAHLYLSPRRRDRAWWPALAERWSALASALLARPSVDLLLLPLGRDRCEVRSATRGDAMVERDGDRFIYRALNGDPLGLGGNLEGDADEVHAATLASDYPDAIVQIASLAGSARAGDILLSAAPGWDFRARYEPIPHRSAHGALHRDHMLVPLLTNRPVPGTPRRTTDLFPSALRALAVTEPAALDGRSFL